MSCFANLSANHSSPSSAMKKQTVQEPCSALTAAAALKLYLHIPNAKFDIVYPAALTGTTQYCCWPGFTLWTPMGDLHYSLPISSACLQKGREQLTGELWKSNRKLLPFSCSKRFYLFHCGLSDGIKCIFFVSRCTLEILSCTSTHYSAAKKCHNKCKAY